jgi:hypothetical protein
MTNCLKLPVLVTERLTSPIAFHVDPEKGKSKAIQLLALQALTGPEGSRRLRLPDFKTIGT